VNGCKILEASNSRDHAHVMLFSNAIFSQRKIIESIKGNSSRAHIRRQNITGPDTIDNTADFVIRGGTSELGDRLSSNLPDPSCV